MKAKKKQKQSIIDDLVSWNCNMHRIKTFDSRETDQIPTQQRMFLAFVVMHATAKRTHYVNAPGICICPSVPVASIVINIT